MAYQNINFPTLKLIHGFRTSYNLPTTVVSNFAKEYRITRYANSKRTFTFPGRNLKWADWQVLSTFFNTVTWQTDSFNLVIPDGSGTARVRLASFPTVDIVATDSSNSPIMVFISDIVLIEVFNE
jgi:hypothetical protein